MSDLAGPIAESRAPGAPPFPPAPEISAVIVSYNVRALLDRCLRSLELSDQTEAIVVDNASTDGTAAFLDRYYPTVRLIANRTNPGFGAANNQGMELARGTYVLFLNPDAELRPGALASLREALAARPEVGVVGPRLRYADGRIQSSRRRFPTLITALAESTVLERWWPNSPAVRSYRVRDSSDDEAREVDWLNGACLLTRRAVIDRVGGFDPRFFMYSEELDWCRRVREAGWPIVYWPAAEVIHHEGKSSEQNLARRAQNFNESKARYFEKYYGKKVGQALRVYLFANTLYDLIGELLKLTIGHKVALRRQRIEALRSVASFQWRQFIMGCGRR